MRLLQLATGPGELIDLHPNVTVVTGLDRTGRQLLADAISGLAAGRASTQRGLLEAHGVLFDLAPEAIALLDIASDDVDPVVTADHLPFARPAPAAPEVAQVPSDLEARWAAATEADQLARAAVLEAAAAVASARAARQAQAEAASRPSRAVLTQQRDEAIERRQQLTAELAALAEAVAEATAAREEVEASTAEVRDGRANAEAASAAMAARLAAARVARDPDAADALEAATATLAEIDDEVDAAREAAARPAPPEPDEPPAERLARVDAEIEELERRLVAFGPADVARVEHAMEPLRALGGGSDAPMPEAVALAAQLEALETELVSTEARGGMPGAGLAEGRARLDDARQALLEAEQAARRPDLDRDLVDRLEAVHARLLDAIEKAGGRVFKARAERRVDDLRAEESAVLAELDLPSYSDYMMGSSLLHVDPAKEAALDAARAELASAEDAWQLLSAQTDTELARAERMEERRHLLDDARRLLGRPVPTGSVIGELRAIRVEAEPPAELTADLRAALDEVGVALGDEDVDRAELVLVAEAWLVEAADASARERSLREDLDRLRAERAEATAAVEAVEVRAAVTEDPAAEAQLAERRTAAQEALVAAEARQRAHLAVEREVATLAEELAAVEAAERAARAAAADADAAVAAAVQAEGEAEAAHAQAEDELAAAVQAEVTATEELDARAGEDDPPPEDLTAALAEAEVVHLAATGRAAEAARVLAGLETERAEVAAASMEPSDDGGPPQPTPLSEEVEWYLLARLAAQRSISLGGSLPLLLDDALAGMAQADLEHVLGRLERMSEAVQVIVVTDDPAAVAWAGMAGADRAAVVRPEASSTV